MKHVKTTSLKSAVAFIIQKKTRSSFQACKGIVLDFHYDIYFSVWVFLSFDKFQHSKLQVPKFEIEQIKSSETSNLKHRMPWRTFIDLAVFVARVNLCQSNALSWKKVIYIYIHLFLKQAKVCCAGMCWIWIMTGLKILVTV